MYDKGSHLLVNIKWTIFWYRIRHYLVNIDYLINTMFSEENCLNVPTVNCDSKKNESLGDSMKNNAKGEWLRSEQFFVIEAVLVLIAGTLVPYQILRILLSHPYTSDPTFPWKFPGKKGHLQASWSTNLCVWSVVGVFNAGLLQSLWSCDIMK